MDSCDSTGRSWNCGDGTEDCTEQLTIAGH